MNYLSTIIWYQKQDIVCCSRNTYLVEFEIINLQMNILKFFFPKRKREVDTHESDVQVNKRSKIE
jgi:hypothetical protein